jgi:hypothetical protein
LKADAPWNMRAMVVTRAMFHLPMLALKLDGRGEPQGSLGFGSPAANIRSTYVTLAVFQREMSALKAG